MDKHLNNIFRTLRLKGYSGAIKLQNNGEQDYSGHNFDDGVIEGNIIGKGNDNENISPVKYVVSGISRQSIHNTRRRQYTLGIHEGKEGERISIEESPRIFSKYARRVLDDLESFAASLPPAFNSAFATRENLKRAIGLCRKTNVAAGLKSYFLVGVGGGGCLCRLVMNRNINLDRTETSRSLHALSEVIDNPDTDLDSIISDPDSLPDEKAGELLRNTIIPMLPLLDENELLAEISTTEEGEKLFDYSEAIINIPYVEGLLTNIAAQFNLNLSSKYGDMSSILKARQAEIFLALHSRPYFLKIPVNDASCNLSFKTEGDPWMASSPLSDAAPSGNKTKLDSWKTVGHDISKLLIPQMGLRRFYSRPNNKKFSDYVTGNIMTASGQVVNYFSNTDIISYNQPSQIGGLCCNDNMLVYERVARIVIFNAIREAVMKFRETGKMPVLNIQPLKAMAHEAVAGIIRDTAEGIFSVYTGVIDELMLRFNAMDAAAQDKPCERKIIKKPSDDIKKTTVLIARQIMAGMRKVHEKFDFFDLEEAEVSVNITSGDRQLGEISFLPTAGRFKSNAITSNARLQVYGKDYPLLPLKYSGSVISNNTTGQLLGETLMDLMEKEIKKGERSPLTELINNEETDIFMKGIKKGFDRLHGQLKSRLQKKSEQYYDAFSDQFPEDLFEYYALNNTP